jgi:hypothetical protein
MLAARNVHVVPKEDIVAHTTDENGACVCWPSVHAIREVTDPDNPQPAILYMHHSLAPKGKFVVQRSGD